MKYTNHSPRRLSGASLFVAALLAGILLHANTASARAVSRSRSVHRSGPYRSVSRSRSVHRGSTAHYGGSVRYSSRSVHHGGAVHHASRTVVRAPVAPVRRTVHAIGHVVHALPGGCTTVRVHGVTHYKYGGVYYRPYYQGTTMVYKVVKI